jgi:hypothetical protein
MPALGFDVTEKVGKTGLVAPITVLLLGGFLFLVGRGFVRD